MMRYGNLIQDISPFLIALNLPAIFMQSANNDHIKFGSF